MTNTFEGHKINYVSKKRYPAIWIDGKNVRIHTIIMERKLGRKLKPEEVVHHIDGDVSNYSVDNLICFATNSNHAGFHKGNEIYFDEEGIAHCSSKSIRIDGIHYKTCPICGNLMTHQASVCKNCYSNMSSKPSKETLQQDLVSLKSFNSIGKKYGVSGNAVKKWCKQYALYEKRITDLPHKQNFMHYLEHHSIRETAIHYGVARGTVDSWIERMHIHIKGNRILCVETNTIYESRIDAAIKLFPTMHPRGVGNKIAKVIDTSTTYKGYHWKSLPKLITSD